MTLYIQDPTDPNSVTLHETLIYGSLKAELGGGAFAFATSGGVKLLLEDNDFIEFANRSGFELIVGVDEITSPDCLHTLQRMQERFATLTTYAFLHDEPGKLFHPKFCWFKTRGGGILITGSGNLTVRGLRGNWEAMTFNELNREQFSDLHGNWIKWKQHNVTRLRSLDDERVVLRVGENLRVRRVVQRRILDEVQAEGNLEDPEDIRAWDFDDDSELLIAEIPRAGDRWNQVNFDRESFVGFFGANPGDNSLIVLFRNVPADRRVGIIESRPSVTVRSRNFRFELEAAAGLNYPADGRPVGIFIRVSRRMFLYSLVMPGDAHYQAIVDFLNRTDVALGEVRRFRSTVNALRNVIPDLPIWNPVFG